MGGCAKPCSGTPGKRCPLSHGLAAAPSPRGPGSGEPLIPRSSQLALAALAVPVHRPILCSPLLGVFLRPRLCAPPASPRLPGRCSPSPSPGRASVRRSVAVSSFLPRRLHSAACVGPVCAPMRVCAGGTGPCAPVSAWLTKAPPAAGSGGRGWGGSVALGDPGCGLQLALGREAPAMPFFPCSTTLGPGLGRRPRSPGERSPNPLGFS